MFVISIRPKLPSKELKETLGTLLLIVKGRHASHLRKWGLS